MACREGVPEPIQECGLTGFGAALDDVARGDTEPNRADILRARGLRWRERDHRLVARTGRPHTEQVFGDESAVVVEIDIGPI